MRAALALVLHAHMPFVRHPEHRSSLEEQWFFEAVTECYIPLLQTIQGWETDRVPAKLSLTLTPTLCAMLEDKLLRERLHTHLDRLVELADAEAHRTRFEKVFQELALFYHDRLQAVRKFYEAQNGDLLSVFRRMQECGRIEILTSAGSHAILPFLTGHKPSLRAQVCLARDDYRRLFGAQPLGFWLPECAYAPEVEPVLKEAGLKWFVLDTQGLLHATPVAQFGSFAPVITPSGLAAFARDKASARQVWSRDEGYPGDPWYRDFYRDIGFDLDLDYVAPHLPARPRRTFTGIKYFRITGGNGPKQPYDRPAALERAREHARHFIDSRRAQTERLAKLMDHPVVLCPYDAELFGHWWYEGPEFLDALARALTQSDDLQLTTPSAYLRAHSTHQVCTPATCSWGEQGFFRVWLNEKNHWIIPHLDQAQSRMTALVRKHGQGMELARRALRQLGRELILAQSSDWPFILRTGTSPDYATKRVKSHLLRFQKLAAQLENGIVSEQDLSLLESQDNLLPGLDYSYWH